MAKLLLGREVADALAEDLKARVEQLQQQATPRLVGARSRPEAKGAGH